MKQFSGTGILRGNLGGNLSIINLATIAGNQYVSIICPLPGDFDHNGAVDTGDYIVWRKDPNRTQVEYDVWRAHFGQTAGRGNDENGAVQNRRPQPYWFSRQSPHSIWRSRSVPVCR